MDTEEYRRAVRWALSEQVDEVIDMAFEGTLSVDHVGLFVLLVSKDYRLTEFGFPLWNTAWKENITYPLL